MNSSELKQLLHEIDIKLNISDNKFESKAVFDLFQMVELLNKDNETLKIENQKLRDEVNLLKGEDGKPKVLGKTKGDQGNVSSDSERKRREPKAKRKSKEGTKAKDSFLTITQTAKKLGVNAYEYIADRVSKKFRMPSLADLIIQNFQPQIE